MFNHQHLEVKASSSVSSSLTISEANQINSTQSEIKEVTMKKTSFIVNLKLKWVVGVIVPLTLGLGAFHARSNDSFAGC